MNFSTNVPWTSKNFDASSSLFIVEFVRIQEKHNYEVSIDVACCMSTQLFDLQKPKLRFRRTAILANQRITTMVSVCNMFFVRSQIKDF